LRNYIQIHWKIEKKWTNFYTHDYPKLKEDVSHLKRFIACNEIEVTINSLPKKKSPGPNTFPAEFYQTFREQIPALLKIFHEI
jgi:hypothetical protein